MFFKRGAVAGLLTLLLLLSFSVLAHVEDEEEAFRLDEYVENESVKFVIAASVIILLLVFIAIYFKPKGETAKFVLFTGIAIITIVPTIYLTGSTIYLNLISETSGPVHWHADFEIWNCGQKIDVKDPKGLLNRIGTPTFHEHNDDRIHVEGTVLEKRFVDLHTFFRVIGGALEHDYLAASTNTGLVEMRNGQVCNGQPATLQVFLYRITNPNAYARSGFLYEQIKLDDFENYVLSPYSNVPPGDCIVIEFGDEKATTDNLCASYQVAEQRGDLSRGS